MNCAAERVQVSDNFCRANFSNSWVQWSMRTGSCEVMVRAERRTKESIQLAAQARMAVGSSEWEALSKSLARFLY